MQKEKEKRREASDGAAKLPGKDLGRKICKTFT